MAAKSLATYHGQPPTNGKDRQCEAASNSRGGERCPNAPIRGSNVCYTHGGKAKQVKEAADLRLARLVDPAINVIAKEITAKVRHSDIAGRKLRASIAQDVLDRNGYKGKTKLEVTGNFSVDPKNLSEEHLRAILALREQLSTQVVGVVEPTKL